MQDTGIYKGIYLVAIGFIYGFAGMRMTDIDLLFAIILKITGLISFMMYVVINWDSFLIKYKQLFKKQQ